MPARDDAHISFIGNLCDIRVASWPSMSVVIRMDIVGIFKASVLLPLYVHVADCSMGTGFLPQRLSVSACHVALMRHHVPVSIHGLVPAFASRLVLDGRCHCTRPRSLFFQLIGISLDTQWFSAFPLSSSLLFSPRYEPLLWSSPFGLLYCSPLLSNVSWCSL